MSLSSTNELEYFLITKCEPIRLNASICHLCARSSMRRREAHKRRAHMYIRASLASPLPRSRLHRSSKHSLRFPRFGASVGDIRLAAGCVARTAWHSERHLSPSSRSGPREHRIVQRFGVGVCLCRRTRTCCTPWKPFMTVYRVQRLNYSAINPLPPLSGGASLRIEDERRIHYSSAAFIVAR